MEQLDKLYKKLRDRNYLFVQTKIYLSYSTYNVFFFICHKVKKNSIIHRIDEKTKFTFETGWKKKVKKKLSESNGVDNKWSGVNLYLIKTQWK